MAELHPVVGHNKVEIKACECSSPSNTTVYYYSQSPAVFKTPRYKMTQSLYHPQPANIKIIFNFEYQDYCWEIVVLLDGKSLAWTLTLVLCVNIMLVTLDL